MTGGGRSPAFRQAPAMSKASGASTAPAVNQAPPIDALVERLAARLKENGADVNGWVMLIRSYAIMKRPDKIQEAAASARKQFASDPEALKQIDEVLSAWESRRPESASAKAPADAPHGGQNAMIRGMVGRARGAAQGKRRGFGWLA